MLAELFGRSNGYCRGKGGSMHLADFSVGMLGANGIVGAGMPDAARALARDKIWLRAAIDRGGRLTATGAATP